MTGAKLDREEYVEQEYFYRVYRERLESNVPSQEILTTIGEEILATTRLPMAIDFMRAEILHSGRISNAMVRLKHYFTPFQAFVIERAEDDESRFEQLTALRILEREAHYRARNAVPAGLFIYQFECIARNRLGYNEGLLAMSQDPMYDERWAQWILKTRMDLGSRELAEVVYVASQHFRNRRASVPGTAAGTATPPADTEIAEALFGDQEGRIARANIGRDPLYFFAALQRQLDYPSIPRSARDNENDKLPAFLEARLLKIEQRIKLVEMEQRGGIDLAKFYRAPEERSGARPNFPDDIPDLG